MTNPLLAYLAPSPAKPTETTAQIENLDVSYDEIVRKLYKMSISGLPRIRDSKIDQSWRSKQEKLDVLKTFEVLLARRKKTLSNITHRAEDRIEPLTVRMKGQEDHYNQLKLDSKEMDGKIEAAKQRLEEIRKQKEELKKQNAAEMKDILSQIQQIQGIRA